MAATKTAGRGLSTDDLARIRDTLATGRRPKVMFTAAAGQIAGQTGQVVGLTDPAVSDEWVVVRFGRDELPFSPTDLAVPPRGAAARAAPRRAESTPSSAVEETSVPPGAPLLPAAAPPAVNGASPARAVPARRGVGRAVGSDGSAAATAGSATAGSAAATAGSTGGAAAPVSGSPGGAAPPAVFDAPAASGGSGPAATTGGSPAGPTTGASAADDPGAAPAEGRSERRPAGRRTAKPKPPASLTVTLTYADGEWMVGATQGSRALAKPYVIKPAEALKMISLLDVPGVHEAVDEIVSAARDEAEREAQRLRAELAEVESRLAELRDAS